MFITKQDLGNSMYGYQMEQITEGDDNIVNLAIAAAIDEVKSYLTGNNRTEGLDGRIVYDADAIFSARGKNRNALIMELTKAITKWWIVDLCNSNIVYEQAKERYVHAVEYLKKLAKGELTLKALSVGRIANNSNENENAKQRFCFGSHKKI